MTAPDLSTLYDLIDQSWPAAERQSIGPWTIRRGDGGGSRVSSATATGPASGDDLAMAEDAMRDLGQTQQFMIRVGDEDLDRTLEAAGYAVKDPTVLLAAPVTSIAIERPKTLSSFAISSPLACQRSVWAAGGIGPERLAVMDRCTLSKTTLLGRRSETPAGAAFVAANGPHAMLHALEVATPHRRTGLGRDMTVSAAFWAQAQDAQWFTLLVTRANEGAIALYSSLGMSVVGQYHYRIKQ